MSRALLANFVTGALAAALAASGCSGAIDDGRPGQGNQGNPGTGGGVVWQPTPCTQGVSLAPARVWRLTDQQYVNVVAQVFGVRMPSEITQAQSAPTPRRWGR